MQNPILTFKIGPNIVLWYKNQILTFKMGPNAVFWHSKSYSDIRNRAEYRILTLKSYFYMWNRAEYIIFWHSKFYFVIRTAAEYRILTFKILFWHSKLGRSRITTFKILFWNSKICRQNIPYYVAACVIPFNLICNMTIFWRSWILSFRPHHLSPPRGPAGKIFPIMLLHVWFLLIWYATWPYSEEVEFWALDPTT